MRLFIIFSMICFALFGCGTISTVDKEKIDMMPKSIAISIFEKYGLKNWVEKPYLSNIGSYCGKDKEYIEFEQIERSIYIVNQNALLFMNFSYRRNFYCPQISVTFPNISKDQAEELTDAIRSLGAVKVDKLEWQY